MTSLDLFQARPEIDGNFGYLFIGWKVNSEDKELDEIYDINWGEEFRNIYEKIR